ncbi:hypothetical protein VitviT2T_011426 [Vitis vinifera]|uniref:Reverse transcriptase zinc-binding domain-containing protein n=1 Tax=Vitis vinifera TaxID=29760 RepID=A0ABY9CAZ2_VITVI|nr:hypothetical protein VitviT2T_011426 [Vitis vinifera]
MEASISRIVVVGDGDRIRFWDDLWWGDQPLGTQYPRLLSVVTDKNALISSILGYSRPFSWNFNFRRNLTDSEIEDLESLMRSLDRLHISPSVPDKRSWSISPSGLFTVKSFFLALSQHSESPPVFPTKFVWNSQVPFKVKSFVWLVAHKKLNTNDLLQLRRPHKALSPNRKQLEDSGVLNESLRSRSNSWGLHMPLVCPDGAVVAYAWKRQLAGQAGASAVDRTRLALKAFTDQKRRFFPHLDDGLNGQSSASESVPKKHCGSQISTVTQQEELSDYRTLSDVLMHVEKDMPNMKIFTYQRLDWLKRASTLPCSAEEFLMDSSKEHDFHISNKPRLGLLGAVAADKVAVIELLFPSIFRAIISLHPAGSIDPDAVAFFSPDEGGSYVHARGFSVYHVFKHVTEHAAMALQHFLGTNTETALYSLLHWIFSYQTLFTEPCSKCKRLLSMDRQSDLLGSIVTSNVEVLDPLVAVFGGGGGSCIISNISNISSSMSGSVLIRSGLLVMVMVMLVLVLVEVLEMD